MNKRKRKEEKPLTDLQKKAVAMFYDYERIKDIAAACGVHRTTIWRWSKLRGFRKEYNRIDRNWKRKFERQDLKRIAAENAYWDQKVADAEKKLQEISSKIKGKPGKDFYSAWNEYEKALFRGRSLSQLMDAIYGDKPKRHKRRRA